MKKIISLILVVTLMAMPVMTVSAETEVMTRDQQATIMNQLDILRGDGIDYKLDGQLKRSEAAAFVVRLVGMDAEVTNNKGEYLQMDFTDVPSHEWYAPYVGYCSSVGIIGGFGDGTFKPDDYVSEQAFLKMILTALGYEYEKDFVWGTVFASAYNLKVVTDEAYATRTKDNLSYTRGEVVTALFNTLKNKKNGTDDYMLQYFVDEALITEEESSDYGLVAFDSLTEITKYELLNNHIIQVTFNESIEGLSVEHVNAKNVSDDVEVIVSNVAPGEYGDNYLISLKNDMLPDRTYVIDIFNIEDSKGNVTDKVELSITVERSDEVTSNYFMISKVEPIDKNTVNVYYTHPVNDNVLEPSAYSIKQGDQLIRGGNGSDIKVGLLAGTKNGVVVTLDDYSMLSGMEYSLVVDGTVISQYGVELNDGDGDYAKFTGITAEAVEFAMTEITADTTKAIVMTFTEPVNEALAEQVYNYYVTNSSDAVVDIETAEVFDGGYKVRLTTSAAMTDKATYTVRIVNLSDAASVEQIIGMPYTVKVDKGTHVDIKVKSVTVVDPITVDVTFDTALEAVSAVKTNYYQIKSEGSYTYTAVPTAIYYDATEDPMTVRLFLAATKSMSVNGDYELIVNPSIEDVSGESQSTWVKKTFTNKESQIDKAVISEAVVVGDNTIKLSFDKEIALDVPNVLNTNYTLSYEVDGQTYTKTPVSANYIDAKTVVVKFVGLVKGTSYTVSFDELVDYSGITTDNSSGKYSEKVEW